MKEYPKDKRELLQRITEMVYSSEGNTEWFYYYDNRNVDLFGPPDPSMPQTLVLQFNGGQFDVDSMKKHIVDLVDQNKKLEEVNKILLESHEATKRIIKDIRQATCEEEPTKAWWQKILTTTKEKQ